MKKSIFIFLVFILFGWIGISAQKPQEILGIAKEQKTAVYYKEQSSLWKKETQKTPKNGHAWFQYYKAERAYLQKTYPQKWADSQAEVFGMLQPIIAEAKKQTDHSFEYYIMESYNCRGDKAMAFAKKAYAKDPNRKETYGPLLIHYALSFQEEQAAEIARKILDVNLYSNANYKWNYNALQTAEPNGVYISNGDMDALPRWVLQHGRNIRKDVLVVSKWMLTDNDSYRKTVFKKLGMRDLSKSLSDYASATDYADELAAHILKNSSRPVYMSCGTDVQFFKNYGLKENMYLVGTAFRYAANGIDNMALTLQNFEEKYELDYLLNDFQSHPEQEMVKKWMNVTYIPGLMKMKKYFDKSNQPQKAAYYQRLIEKIAVESGRESEIKSWY